LKECFRTTQYSRAQQIRLNVKGSRFQPRIPALAHCPLHVFPEDLYILQEAPLKSAAPLGIRPRLPYPLQRQSEVAASDLLTKKRALR